MVENYALAKDVKNTIMGWDFSENEVECAIRNRKMLSSSIDLSNSCNLNCAYCYVEEKNSVRKLRKKNEITIEETKAIIEDVLRCGTKTINIVGAGEPTIDPFLEEIVDYIDKKGAHVVLFTNGIRLAYDIELARFLYARNVSIVLKFDSLENNLQDLIAGRKGYAAKRNRALELLIDCGFSSQLPTRLGVDVVVFEGNLEEVPQIHEMCRRRNLFPIIAEYIPTGRTEGGTFQGYEAIRNFRQAEKNKVTSLLKPITAKERKELLRRLFLIDRKYNIVRDRKPAYFSGASCTQMLGLYVDIQGNVWPCVARKKIVHGKLENGFLGNVREGRMPCEAWKTDSYIDYLLSIYDGSCPYKANLAASLLE